MNSYKPKGVCSREIKIKTEGGKIAAVEFTGGCHGNLQAVSKLVEGMDINEAIAKLKGIRCGSKPTSCPDQLAAFLERELAAQK